MVEPFLLVIASVLILSSFAFFKAEFVSEVSPDCVIKTYKISLSCGTVDFSKNSLEYIARASIPAILPNRSAVYLAQ